MRRLHELRSSDCTANKKYLVPLAQADRSRISLPIPIGHKTVILSVFSCFLRCDVGRGGKKAGYVGQSSLSVHFLRGGGLRAGAPVIQLLLDSPEQSLGVWQDAMMQFRCGRAGPEGHGEKSPVLDHRYISLPPAWHRDLGDRPSGLLRLPGALMGR